MPRTDGISIDGPEPGSSADCDRILRALPDWFGIEEAIVEYVQTVPDLPTFTAREEGEVVGFLSIRRHFPAAAEVYLIAVLQPRHRRGVGRRLLAAAERWLRAEGVEYLQVKTLGPSRPDASYGRTRQFYEAVGFRPLEEFPTLWNEANPCLVMVKSLEA